MSKDINQNAADRISRALEFVERGWIKGYEAKGPDGWTCSPKAVYAKCWCATGAMMAAGCTSRDFERVASCLGSWKRRGHGSAMGLIVNYNDHPDRTKADIVSLFRVAIRKFDRSRPVRGW